MLWSTLALAGPVSLFLNDPRGRAGPTDGCADPHCEALLDRLEGARTTIDFAVYGFRDQPAIVDALVAAQDRGVTVRGVVDANADGVNYYTSTAAVRARLGTVRTDEASDRDWVAAQRDFPYQPSCARPTGFDGPLQCLGYDLGDRCLLAAHASREPIVSDGRILHHKFFVVDGRTVWTGSTNVSDSGTGGYNANLVVTVDDPVVAGWYTHEFEQMYVHGRFHDDKEATPPRRWRVGGTAVTGLFSPTDRPITRHLRPLLQGARESIDVAVFFLTHKHLTADLIAAHRRGVRVRVLLDATAAKNGYSKHELLRAAGIPVKVEDWGGKMHAKAAAIDGTVLVTGSMNWTSAGEGGNDENTLLLHDPVLARQYARWFDALWADVDDRWLTDRPDPESLASGTSCTDGVDNDFDHRADGVDPGCRSDPPALPALPPYRIVARTDGHDLIKGATVAGRRVWMGPRHPDYARTATDHWFCSRYDAEDAGYRRARGVSR
jgi:phosphatidylserine/phosphatidylglycerophosphate/cardiolipin synthase-like enzyme